MPDTPKERLSRKAAQVLADLAYRTGEGMAGAMGTTKFSVDEDASQYWLDVHADTVCAAVDDREVDWERSKNFARKMARRLGATAARLAIQDAGKDSEQMVTVKLDHLKAASAIVKRDVRQTPGVAMSCEYCGLEG